MLLIARVVAIAALLIAGVSLSQAAIIHFGTVLGPEVPGATGSGNVTVDYDTTANTFLIEANWSGLSGTTTVAHIHCCVAPPGTVGVAFTPVTLPGFPAGLSAGSYTSPLIDLDDPLSFTGSFVTNFAGGDAANADDALIAGINAGQAYFNIHSSTFGSGEIRGFLQQIPEPGTLALLALGLVGLGFSRRRH